jgi:hypothetical protein
MSGNTQFDLHPDAESLNAFAEQALGGPERERMMAHLAVCGRCREIVFLAQEEIEPAAAATRIFERRPWFRNWRLAWIPLGALAAGITAVYVTYSRHEEPANQVAVVEREASPVIVTQQMAPLPAEPAKGEDTVRKQPRPVVAQAPPPSPVANEPAGAVAQNALTMNGAAVLKSAPEGAVAQSQRGPQDIAREMQVPMAKRAPTASADKAMQEQYQVSAAAAPMTQAEAAVEPRAARTFGAPRTPTTSMAVYMARQTGLPSGLAAVSIVAVGHNMLAVDKAGRLFLSTDGGQHWDSIKQQWSGQAVAVRTRQGSKGSADAAVAGAASAGSAAAGGGTSQAGFQLVNDQGRVWVSPDGRTWKAQ